MFPIAANRSDEENTTPYVDDVFSTTLYTGTGNSVTQRIASGIDLATKGGMVWVKNRTEVTDHQIYDTARGEQKYIRSNTTDAEFNSGANQVQYKTSGWDAFEYTNTLNKVMTSWTFRKAAKFFDVVTYTGNGAGFGGSYTINHKLGVTPGLVIIKNTSGVGHWFCFARGESRYYDLFLSLTAAASPSASDAATYNLTASSFDPAKFQNLSSSNTNGQTYVAYLFAHDTSADGIIQCGSFTTDGSGNATVNLGWEPQFLLRKVATDVGNWNMWDTMRGFTASNSVQTLVPNLTNEEFTSSGVSVTSTGFIVSGFTPSVTAIYMAIRRPNKPPTSGTQVYNAIAYTGNDASNRKLTGLGFPPDLALVKARSQVRNYGWEDRLRGADKWLVSSGSDSEGSFSDFGAGGSLLQDGITIGANGLTNEAPTTYIFQGMRRASGFFDIVCYKGTGVSPASIPHNLGVVPELIILKSRTIGYIWYVFSAAATGSQCLILNRDFAWVNYGNPARTSTTFTVTATTESNDSGADYVAYLFATLAGISKVGSYTGNGSSQNIECGFAAGARFVLIKRTDSTGDWYTWDTARGIVTGNDPHLSLNTTVAEVTTDDSIDPYSAGFTVNQVAATNINVTSATYIFLAIS